MIITTVFLDMDDVIADFVGGVCRHWHVSRGEVERHWTKGKWDIIPPLSKVLGLDKPMDDKVFWDHLDRREEFWLNLDLKSFTFQLIQHVTETVGNEWYVLTSPSECPTCYTGKIKWLWQALGQRPHRMIPTPHKHLLAKPGTLLIDDRESNVEKFRAAGGSGILYPSHYNSAHDFVDDPVPYIMIELMLLQD